MGSKTCSKVSYYENFGQEVKCILAGNNLEHYFDQNVNRKIIIQSLKESLFRHDINEFKTFCLSSSMLQFYSKINNFEDNKQYLSMPLSFQFKKRFVQCRLGILPIRHHTGRFERLSESDRVCQNCNLDQCENNEHFILICPFYQDERKKMFSKIDSFKFSQCISNLDKLNILLNDPSLVRIVANYILNCLDLILNYLHYIMCPLNC